jgi:hypothetical protein
MIVVLILAAGAFYSFVRQFEPLFAGGRQRRKLRREILRLGAKKEIYLDPALPWRTGVALSDMSPWAGAGGEFPDHEWNGPVATALAVIAGLPEGTRDEAVWRALQRSKELS